MIYNLVQHLKTEFPSETIFTNVEHKISGEVQIPDRRVLVRDTGGGDQPWARYVTYTVQILCRDFAPTQARDLADDIFTELHGRFGLQLPAVTVDGTTFPLLATAQIKAIQRPFSLGIDDNGRTEFTTNYQITFDAS